MSAVDDPKLKLEVVDIPSTLGMIDSDTKIDLEIVCNPINIRSCNRI